MRPISYFDATEISWKHEAACRTDDASLNELFFGPARPEQKRERELREAKARKFCSDCPVSNECEAYAVRFRSTEGIWNGRTGSTLLRRYRRKAIEEELRRSKLVSGQPGR